MNKEELKKLSDDDLYASAKGALYMFYGLHLVGILSTISYFAVADNVASKIAFVFAAVWAARKLPKIFNDMEAILEERDTRDAQ